MTLSRNKLSAFVALALAGSAGGATAAGFQLLEQNASGMGNAYAGQAAAAENASTIFFNPAAMTLLPGTQFTASAMAIQPSINFTNSGASQTPGGAAAPAGGGNGGDAGGWNYVPSLFLSKQFSPNLWAGIGLSVPFGLKTTYDGNFIGRFQSQKTQITSYDLNPSIAYRLSDTLSLGGGVSYQRFNIKLERSAFVGVETPTSLDLTDDQWGWNIGALVTLTPATRLGLSYRSGIGHTVTGNVHLNGVAGFPTAGTANVRLPATTSAALSHQLNDRWQLLGDVTLTQWSSIKTVPLVLASGAVADTFNFQFRDSWRIAAGANYKWQPDLTLKLGVAYETSPVTNEFRTTALPDNDRVWVGVGGKWALSRQSTVDFGYAHLFVPNRGTINQVRGTGVLAQGSVVGIYSGNFDMLSVQYSYAF
jgi:long-chain fatty acid transport protein